MNHLSTMAVSVKSRCISASRSTAPVVRVARNVRAEAAHGALAYLLLNIINIFVRSPVARVG